VISGLSGSEGRCRTVTLPIDPTRSFTGDSFHDVERDGTTGTIVTAGTATVAPVLTLGIGLTLAARGAGTISPGAQVATEQNAYRIIGRGSSLGRFAMKSRSARGGRFARRSSTTKMTAPPIAQWNSTISASQ
jgi:hypothetical protein